MNRILLVVALLVPIALLASMPASAAHARQHARAAHARHAIPQPWPGWGPLATGPSGPWDDPGWWAPLPESGPCFYHGGVVSVVLGTGPFGEQIYWYTCVDGTVIPVDDFADAPCDCGQSYDPPPADATPPDDNAGSPPSDYEAPDDPCLTAPWSDGCSGGS